MLCFEKFRSEGVTLRLGVETDALVTNSHP